jgi:hypothetical protein
LWTFKKKKKKKVKGDQVVAPAVLQHDPEESLRENKSWGEK